MILDSGLLFWATLYMYCQHSYVSRKIHTRQCYCIIFTTSCFQCHSALPLLCVRRPAQSSLLQWFTRKWVPHQISSSGQPRPWSSPGWRLMSHQSWTWIGWIHGGFSYSAVEHRMYAVTKKGFAHVWSQQMCAAQDVDFRSVIFSSECSIAFKKYSQFVARSTRHRKISEEWRWQHSDS